MIIPNMGIIVQGKALWKVLFTRTRRRVLGLLFGYPERSFYANEIVRLAGVGTGSVQRELASLRGAGLLTVTRIGNQKHYQANPDCPFFPEIHSLVVKTYGTLSTLRAALNSLDGRIELAFLYGPAADELAPPGAELDLLVVSDALHRKDMEATIEEAGRRIGRTIRLVLLRRERFEAMRAAGDARLTGVLEQPRIMLIGNL